MLSQPRYIGKCLGPTSNDVTDFDYPVWEASLSLGSGCGVGWGDRWGEWEEGREGCEIGV